MEAEIDNRVKDTLQENKNLMRMLDRGIDDMEEGNFRWMRLSGR